TLVYSSTPGEEAQAARALLLAEVSNLPRLLSSVYLLTESGELSTQKGMRLWANEADAQVLLQPLVPLALLPSYLHSRPHSA
ncbi:hypothetical protein DUNSADRAFT_723, partial [Dunaliella salina]